MVMSSSNWCRRLSSAVSNFDLAQVGELLLQKELMQKRLQRQQIWQEDAAPLHLAAFFGHDGLVRMLIECGFDPDSFVVTKDGYKVTPLHWATYKNQVSTVQLLLRMGADPGLVGKWGMVKGTAMDFARKRKFPHLFAILAKATNEDGKEEEKFDNNASFSGEDEQRLLELRGRLRQELRGVENQLREISRNKTNSNNKNNSCFQNDLLDEDLQCAVCLLLPRFQIRTCVECDVLLCHACSTRLEACPCCRCSFRIMPPRRNRWAERLVKGDKDK